MLNFEELPDSLHSYELQLFDNVATGYIPTDTHPKLNTKDILESSERFIGRYTCKSLFLIKFQAVHHQLYEKETLVLVFFSGIWKILYTTFL